MTDTVELSAPDIEAIKTRFAEQLDLVQRIASYQFRHLRGADKEDAIAETIAFAWREYRHQALAGGDPDRLLPSIVRFSAKRYRAGSRVAGSPHVRDALVGRGGSPVTFLPTSENEAAAHEAHDAMRDRRPGPDEEAVTNLDYQAMLSKLSDKEKDLAEGLKSGEYPAEVAQRRGVKNQAVLDMRKTLGRKWGEREGYSDPLSR